MIFSVSHWNRIFHGTLHTPVYCIVYNTYLNSYSYIHVIQEISFMYWIVSTCVRVRVYTICLLSVSNETLFQTSNNTPNYNLFVLYLGVCVFQQWVRSSLVARYVWDFFYSTHTHINQCHTLTFIVFKFISSDSVLINFEMFIISKISFFFLDKKTRETSKNCLFSI